MIVDVDTMKQEQLIGPYMLLQKNGDISQIVLFSCFFKHHDVVRLRLSDLKEDSMTLKEASNTFANEFRTRDENLNSPKQSQFLSMNPDDNYMLMEGICMNLKISEQLSSLTFCGVRLAKESIKLVGDAIKDNRVLKELGFNFCFLDHTYLE